MSEADLTRAVILEGAEKTGEASKLIEKIRAATNTDVNVALNSAKVAINRQIREILTSIARLREATEHVTPYLAGSGVGYVANGVRYLDTAEQELIETAKNLKFMADEIEKWQRQIVPVIDRDLTEQGNNIREAAAQFRNYANVL